jgi:hypothetical protein
MNDAEPRETAEEMDRCEGLAAQVVECGYPEPCDHANDQPEANAFARGAVSRGRVTWRGRARYNVNVFHGIMITSLANVLQ